MSSTKNGKNAWPVGSLSVGFPSISIDRSKLGSVLVSYFEFLDTVSLYDDLAHNVVLIYFLIMPPSI